MDENSANDSSDDEKPWVKEVQKQYRIVKRKEKRKEWEEEREAAAAAKEADDNPDKAERQPKFYEIKEGVEFKGGRTYMKKRDK